MRVLALILLALAVSCVSLIPATPHPLDEAAIACLDMAWAQERTVEVAGGVRPDLTCTALEFGTATTVSIWMDDDWRAIFHTHTMRGRLSNIDKASMLRDVLGRPAYMREPTGEVWVFECWFPEDEGIVKHRCQERRVR